MQDNTTDKTIPSQKEVMPKKKRSFGNRMFDGVFYPLVQWLGVWTVSLAIGNEAQNGTGLLNRGFRKSVDWLTPKLEGFAGVSQTLWNGGTAEQWAVGVTLINALGLGGSVMLPVMKWLEDRRESISTVFDQMAGKQVPKEEIRPEAPQTWGSLISGRIASWSSVFVIFAALGPKTLDWAQNTVGGLSTEAFTRLVPSANKVKVRKISDIAVFDLMLTAVSASIAYVFSRKAAILNQPVEPDTDNIKTVPPVIIHDHHEPGKTDWRETVHTTPRSMIKPAVGGFTTRKYDTVPKLAGMH